MNEIEKLKAEKEVLLKQQADLIEQLKLKQIIMIKIEGLDEVDNEAFYSIEDGVIKWYAGTTWQSLFDYSRIYLDYKGDSHAFYNEFVAPNFQELYDTQKV